jgi:hypothetical protein
MVRRGLRGSARARLGGHVQSTGRVVKAGRHGLRPGPILRSNATRPRGPGRCVRDQDMRVTHIATPIKQPPDRARQAGMNSRKRRRRTSAVPCGYWLSLEPLASRYPDCVGFGRQHAQPRWFRGGTCLGLDGQRAHLSGSTRAIGRVWRLQQAAPRWLGGAVVGSLERTAAGRPRSRSVGQSGLFTRQRQPAPCS